MLGGTANASDLSHIELEKMRANPVDYMHRIPAKYDANQKVRRPSPVFSSEEISSKSYVAIKDEFRRKILQSASGAYDFAPIELGSDDPKNLVDDGMVLETLESVEIGRLTRSTLEQQPWSGDYWPIFKGNIAQRYADPNFPASQDWKENYDYVQANTVGSIIASGQPKAIDSLSPAEKYSLIVGDDRGLLARKLWFEGKYYFEAEGRVETWFGICHGWAPAAFMLDRPLSAITVPARNHDFDVTLYPSDMQALASLAWANARGKVRFVGGRCHDKEPEHDPSGRVTTQECFDNNPGTWHQVVVGQVGKSNRSMVIDATYDYEVWNQPVLSYRYTYFDPTTSRPVGSLKAATVDISNFQNDRFAKYRDSQTRYIVGVSMELTYMIEVGAAQSLKASKADDMKQTVVYLYDLELDADRKIVGGEWYNNSHPDFVWTPEKGSVARVMAEYTLSESWGAGEKVPDGWVGVASDAAKSGQVLGVVVEELIRRAQ